MDEDRAVGRVVWAFGITFPPVFFLCTLYAFLSNAVFQINGYVGDRLPAKLRRALRTGYAFSQCIAGGTLHVSLLYYCSAALFDSCADHVMRSRGSVLMLSIAAIWHTVMTFADRVAIPLLNMPVGVRGYAVSMHQRMLEASAITVAWLDMGEQSTAAVPLMLCLTARRGLSGLPNVCWFYLLILKTVCFHHTTVMLGPPGCGTQKAKGPTVGMLLTVVLI